MRAGATSLFLLVVACQPAQHGPPYLSDDDGGDASKPEVDGGWDAGVTVIAPASNPKGIALFGKYLYYTNFATAGQDGSISFIATDHSMAPLDLVPGLEAPWALTIAPTDSVEGRLYFTQVPTAGSGMVQWIGTNGGTLVVVQTNVTHCYGIANDGANVYWVHDVSGGVAVQSVAIGDIDGHDILTGTGDMLPTALALSAGALFVGTEGTQAALLTGLTTANGNLQSLSGPSAATMSDVVATPTTIYVAYDDAQPNGAIVAVPRFGGSAQTVVSGLNHPQRMALDGSYIYFTDPADGEVWAADTSAKTITLVASGLDSPLPIAVSDALYVGVADAIVRIPKL